MSFAPFSEGPLGPKIHLTKSGSINTKFIDPFRQGIELTEDKFHCLGLVKIHAGYPRHTLPQTQFGEQSDEIIEQKLFVDVDYFNPLTYIEGKSGTKKSGLTYPIVFQHSILKAANVLDGIVEPFAIRHVAMFSSIDAPFEAHSVKGNLESGNYNSYINSDRVVDVQKNSDVTRGIHLFEDNIDNFNGSPINLGYFPNTSKVISPYEDEQIKSGVIVSEKMSESIVGTLTNMTPATDNYLPKNYTRSVVGTDYENVIGSPRSDSIAYGNLTYRSGTLSERIVETFERYDSTVFSFDPTVLPWVGWYRESTIYSDSANPRSVSRWLDLSGYKFDYKIGNYGAPSEGETINENQSIRFDASTPGVLYSSNGILSITSRSFFDVYIVLKITQITTSNSDPRINDRIWGDVGFYSSQMVGLSASTSGGNKLQLWYVNASAVLTTVEVAISLDTWMLIECRLENGRLTISKNRESEISTAATGLIVNSNRYLHLNDPVYPFYGNIAEYGITNTSFDSDERDSYKKYASLKYSLT